MCATALVSSALAPPLPPSLACLHTQLELLRLILPDMEETRALGKFMKAHPDTNPRDLRKAEQVSWHLLKVRRRAVRRRCCCCC